MWIVSIIRRRIEKDRNQGNKRRRKTGIRDVGTKRQMHRIRHFVCVAAWFACSALAAASPYRGVVTFGALLLPGATVTAMQGTTTITALSVADGAFQFDDLAHAIPVYQLAVQRTSDMEPGAQQRRGSQLQSDWQRQKQECEANDFAVVVSGSNGADFGILV